MMASYLSVDPARVHDLHIVQSAAESVSHVFTLNQTGE